MSPGPEELSAGLALVAGALIIAAWRCERAMRRVVSRMMRVETEMREHEHDDSMSRGEGAEGRIAEALR